MITRRFQRQDKFSWTGKSTKLIQITHLLSGSRKSNMVVTKPEIPSVCRHDKKTIPTEIYVSVTGKLTKLIRITYQLSGCRKSSMAATKPKIHIPQLVDKIIGNSTLITDTSWTELYNGTSIGTLYYLTGSGSPRSGSSNRNYD